MNREVLFAREGRVALVTLVSNALVHALLVKAEVRPPQVDLVALVTLVNVLRAVLDPAHLDTSFLVGVVKVWVKSNLKRVFTQN